MVISFPRQGGKNLADVKNFQLGVISLTKTGHTCRSTSVHMDTISPELLPALRLIKKQKHVFAPLSSADQMCFKVFPALMKN